MTYIPTQVRIMQHRDSARLLCAVFPNYPELPPCNPVRVVEATQGPSAAPVYPQSQPAYDLKQRLVGLTSSSTDVTSVCDLSS